MINKVLLLLFITVLSLYGCTCREKNFKYGIGAEVILKTPIAYSERAYHDENEVAGQKVNGALVSKRYCIKSHRYYLVRDSKNKKFEVAEEEIESLAN